MTILFLYIEVMGYTMATIKALVKMGAIVHIVHRDVNKLTPYKINEYKNVYKYKRSEYDSKKLLNLTKIINPDITVVSGWQDKGYLPVALKLRKEGRIVVAAFDAQWNSRMKDYLFSFLGVFNLFYRLYSHAWIPGFKQYEYARRIGFKKKHIVFDLYSADVSLFQNTYESNFVVKLKNYPHRFLYIGRFEKIKGLDILLKAWKNIAEKRLDWELHIFGNGSFRDELLKIKNIVVKEFIQPEELAIEIGRFGCLILPSKAEPWGVVIHEATCAGLPLVVSDNIGATSSFFISGMNGFEFETENVNSLTECLLQIINKTNSELFDFSKLSNKLSTRISPETSAMNLLSVKFKY